jgi:hypothetical protein
VGAQFKHLEQLDFHLDLDLNYCSPWKFRNWAELVNIALHVLATVRVVRLEIHICTLGVAAPSTETVCEHLNDTIHKAVLTAGRSFSSKTLYANHRFDFADRQSFWGVLKFGGFGLSVGCKTVYT